MEQEATTTASGYAFDQLIQSALRHLEERGYSCRSLKRQGSIWRSFCRFAKRQRHGGDTFSQELVSRFLESSGIPNATVRLPKDLQSVRRAMNMLTEYVENGELGPRSKWTPPKPPLPAGFGALLEDYERVYSHRHGYRSSTMKTQRRHLAAFLSWLASRDVVSFDRVSPALLSMYISSLGHLKTTTVRLRLCSLRAFLRHLTTQGVVPQDLVESLPRVRVRSDANIPSVWAPSDTNALLAAVNRETACGKRDFAILLLACRLGMRAGDIRTLRLEHLRWREARIARMQSKTGEALNLPMSNEIGEAIVDYLLHGRPPSSCREVFLQAIAPFQPLSSNCKFWHVVEKHRLLADIAEPRAGQRGLHSLRHTLATRLLENGTPIEIIASVLGHGSIESTRIYTKVDVDALRDAALDPEEVFDA